MAVTVLTPADHRELADLATVKRELEVSGDALDDRLVTWIRQASDAVVRYTRRDWAQEELRETLPGQGTHLVMVSRTPIVSVSQVLLEGNPITDYEVDDAEAGLLFRELGWTWSPALLRSAGDHPLPGSERRNVDVSYVGGYLLPGQKGRTLPEDVEAAVIDVVKVLYQQRGERRDATVASKRIGKTAVTYTTGEAAGLTPRAAEWLRPYRRAA